MIIRKLLYLLPLLIAPLFDVMGITGRVSCILGIFGKGSLVSNHKHLSPTIMIHFLNYLFVLATGLVNEAMATDSPRRPSRCTGGVVVRPQAVT